MKHAALQVQRPGIRCHLLKIGIGDRVLTLMSKKIMILVLRHVIVGKPHDTQWALTTFLFPFDTAIKIHNFFQSALVFYANSRSCFSP